MAVISASRFDFGVPIGAFAGLATFIACAILLRRYGHDRIAGTIEAASLFALISILGMTVSILLAGTAIQVLPSSEYSTARLSICNTIHPEIVVRTRSLPAALPGIIPPIAELLLSLVTGRRLVAINKCRWR